jgi:hypothetical protein
MKVLFAIFKYILVDHLHVFHISNRTEVIAQAEIREGRAILYHIPADS